LGIRGLASADVWVWIDDEDDENTLNSSSNDDLGDELIDKLDVVLSGLLEE